MLFASRRYIYIFFCLLLSHLLLFDEEFVNDSGHPVDSRYRAGDQNSPRKDEEEEKKRNERMDGKLEC